MISKFVLLLAAVAAAVAPAEMVTSLSSPMNDYNLSYDARERSLVFARSAAEFRGAKIFFAEKRGGRWTKPKPISFSNDAFADSDPWLTPDGKTLYFISDRPTSTRGERKDYDIWRSRRIGSEWSAPEHLGDRVNSKGQELGPEFRSGTLYFASARKSGKGGIDIYTSKLGPRGFEEPVLLAGPFNSAESDSDFTLSADGRMAAFWRMVGGRGLIHLSRRSATGWSEPVPLPAAVNHSAFNFTPAFSRDGKRLTFASTAERPGQEKGLADIYVASLHPY